MKVYTHTPRPVILSALKKIAAVMEPTYGPVGKGALIDSGFSQIIADDGFMVIDKLELEDELENAVLKYVREASRKTNSRAGDGTTTAFLILYNLVLEAFGEALVFKKDDVSLEQQLRDAVKVVADKIRGVAREITTIEDLAAIAQNSYANPAVALIIAEAVHAVGKDGIVTVEASDALETVSKVAIGLSVERGYLNNMMAVNTNGIVELQEPIVFITDAMITTLEELTPMMEMASTTKRPLLIVAEDVQGEALTALIVNKIRGTINSCAIKAPGFGDGKADLLEDIATVTGATVVSDKKGRVLSSLNKDDAGSAKSIKVSADMTIFIDGGGTKEAVEARVAEIRARAEGASSVDRERLESRVARLVAGVAVVQVGAPTEAEAKTMKLKVEDAVNATHLALKHGVVTGGGVLLAEQESGSVLLDKALKAPRAQLVKNGEAALTEGAVDPAGVVIAAIESAVSVALALINCGSIIADKREEKKD